VCVWVPPRHTSHGGVALPETRRESLDAEPCEIIAVGPDCKPQFKAGQLILIGNALVKEFRYKGHTYAVMEDKYIVGVVD
jgi:co-chaperonin GroES (HSP10)